jgi:hypothetical protein
MFGPCALQECRRTSGGIVQPFQAFGPFAGPTRVQPAERPPLRRRQSKLRSMLQEESHLRFPEWRGRPRAGRPRRLSHLSQNPVGVRPVGRSHRTGIGRLCSLPGESGRGNDERDDGRGPRSPPGPPLARRSRYCRWITLLHFGLPYAGIPRRPFARPRRGASSARLNGVPGQTRRDVPPRNWERIYLAFCPGLALAILMSGLWSIGQM